MPHEYGEMYIMIEKGKVDFIVQYYRSELLSSTRWELANNVLYELCDKYPDHKDADEIVAKLWLIGRSYAAAIERRKNAIENGGDFYYETVAPAIISKGAALDSKIRMLKSSERLEDLFDTHAFLIEIFRTVTDMDKRSLASKYLHFHCPNTAYIYDSIASTALRKLVKKPYKIELNNFDNYDYEYVDFCIRASELRQYIADEYGLHLTIRELDTLLLHAKKPYWREKR